MDSTLLDSQLYGHRYTRLYLRSHTDLDDLYSAAAQCDYVFAYSRVDLGALDGFTREPKHSQVVGLNGTPDEIFASLGRRARQEIRKTYTDSDLRIVVGDSAHRETYRFYSKVKEQEGARPDVEEDFDSVRWINAYIRDRLVSANSIYSNRSILRGKHLASLRKHPDLDPALIGRINRRLLWEVCALGVAEGHHEFDMGGVDFHDPAKRGISDFKRRFGGETVEIYVYRYSSAAWQAVTQRVRQVGREIL